MERWIITWHNEANDAVGVMREGEDIGHFHSEDEAREAWELCLLSNFFSAWAFDIVNGYSVAL